MSKSIGEMTDAELLAYRKVLVGQVSAYNNQQLVRKVNLNSAYGAIGSNYFRYYDMDMAEAVTKWSRCRRHTVFANIRHP